MKLALGHIVGHVWSNCPHILNAFHSGSHLMLDCFKGLYPDLAVGIIFYKRSSVSKYGLCNHTKFNTY